MIAENTEIPQPIQAFLEEKKFKVEARLRNSRYFLLRVSSPDLRDDLLLKIGEGRPSLQQRNHVLWTKSVEPSIPKEAPFHIAPILDEGAIDGRWYWFLTPFIEGTPFAEMNDDNLSKITFKHPEQVLPNIILLMRHIEKATAINAGGIDARYGTLVRTHFISPPSANR